MIECKLCGKQMRVLKHTHFKFKCVGKITSVKEYKELFPDAETMSADVSNKLGHSEKSFIIRYGELLGKEKWESYCKKLSHKNSLQAFNDKGLSKTDWCNYNKSRASTLENFIIRHGEVLGKEKWESYCKKQSKNGNTLEYFTEKFGEIEGMLKYKDVCLKKGITLENMIRVHGIEKGFAVFNDWLEKTKGNYISLAGSQFVKDIVNILPSNYIFHEGVFGKEFCIWENKPYMYDFVITSPVKKVIEFNGDFWHANPKTYNAQDMVPLRGGPKKAHDIWLADEIKLNAIQKLGYDVLVIWESEYTNNPVKCIEEVKTWILK